MDNGLIQILVVAFFIIISMMDGAARKRRKEAQRLAHTPEPNRLPGADDDLGEAAEASEPVVLKDVWEEITALARGEVPRRGVDSLSGPTTRDPDSTHDDPDSELEAWTAPQQDVPLMRTPAAEGGARVERSAASYDEPDVPSLTETRSADLQGGYLHPDQAASHEKHAHEKHVQVASLPSLSRPVPEELPHEFVPHPAEPPSKPQQALRPARQPGSLLAGVRSGAKSSLQEAIVLAEVLSPPVTLRPSGWKPLF